MNPEVVTQEQIDAARAEIEEASAETTAIVTKKESPLRALDVGGLDILTLGSIFAKSGYFKDIKDASQAIVKIMAGQELGVKPFASMQGIFFTEHGKVQVGAHILAALVKASTKYDYRVRTRQNDLVVIDWYEHGENVGETSFSNDDAATAKLSVSEMSAHRKYPRVMKYCRCITDGVKVYAPEVLQGMEIAESGFEGKSDREIQVDWMKAYFALHNELDLPTHSDKYPLAKKINYDAWAQILEQPPVQSATDFTPAEWGELYAALEDIRDKTREMPKAWQEASSAWKKSEDSGSVASMPAATDGSTPSPRSNKNVKADIEPFATSGPATQAPPAVPDGPVSTKIGASEEQLEEIRELCHKHGADAYVYVINQIYVTDAPPLEKLEDLSGQGARRVINYLRSTPSKTIAALINEEQTS